MGSQVSDSRELRSALRTATAAIALVLWSCQRSVPELPSLLFGSYQPAVREQLEKAYAEVKAQPNSADRVGHLGMILHAYGEYQPAAASYRRARAIAPREFEWAYYLGAVEASSGNTAAAIETLRDAARLRPEDVGTRLRLADLLLTAGKLEEARELYLSAVKQKPEAASAHYGLARVQSALRDVPAALESYRIACELTPQFGAAHYGYAMLLLQQGRASEAAAHLTASESHKNQRPITDDPLMSAVLALKEGAIVHLRRGVTLESAGRLNDSIQETERALAIDPELIQAHINLISLYGRTGQAERAEAQYKKALAVTSDRAELHYNFGVMAAGQKRFSEAARAFRAAININPSYAEAHGNLGAMLELDGRLEEAGREYREAIRVKPQYPLAHYRLGRLLLARGEAAALHHFERALSPETAETPTYMFALAAAHNRLGDRMKAILYGRQAMQQAAARGQTELAGKIARDLQMLERAQNSR
jgi:tetratricopeptide (TPR) repeat protein